MQQLSALEKEAGSPMAMNSGALKWIQTASQEALAGTHLFHRTQGNNC